MNVIAYTVFHRATKGENPILTMPLQEKLQMKVRHLQTKRNLSSLRALVCPKINITLS